MRWGLILIVLWLVAAEVSAYKQGGRASSGLARYKKRKAREAARRRRVLQKSDDDDGNDDDDDGDREKERPKPEQAVEEREVQTHAAETQVMETQHSQGQTQTSETEDDGKQITPWVERFCSAPGHEFYVQVPKSFVDDPVTAAILSEALPNEDLDAALKMISNPSKQKSRYSSSVASDDEDDDDEDDEGRVAALSNLARGAYNIIHSRYIVSAQGLLRLRAKYEASAFGQCPRVYCRGHALLPVGMHDAPLRSSVKVFCPKCRDTFHPQQLRHRSVDGAAFGTSAAHLLLLRHPDLAPVKTPDFYTARVFGYALDDDRSPTMRKFHNSTHRLDPQSDKKTS